MKRFIFALVLLFCGSAVAAPITTEDLKVGGKPWVDVRLYSNDLTAAVTAIGNVTPTKLLVASPAIITGNTTVTPNIQIEVTKTGSINQGAYTLAMPIPEAGLYRIFTGAGAVSFTNEGGSYPEWFGDITAPGAIAKAVNALSYGGSVILDGSNYVESSVTMKSGVYIESRNATVKIVNNAPDSARLFNFNGISNSGIKGVITIDGNKANQAYTDDQHGQFGVYIYAGSSNLHFGTIVANNCSQDGVYIGGNGTAPKNIFFDTIVSDGAIRNGVSITNADGVYIKNIIGRNTTGSSPGFGVDIEGNAAENKMNVYIDNLITHGNNTHGLGIGQSATLTESSIKINKWTSHNNNGNGGYILGTYNLVIASADVHSNGLNGLEIPRNVRDIKIRGRFYNNGRRGLSLVMSTQAYASYNLDFSGSSFNNNSQAAPGTYDGVTFSSDSASYIMTDINFDGCSFYDSQGVSTQRYGMTGGTNCQFAYVRGRFYGNSTGNYTFGATKSYLTAGLISLSATIDFPSVNNGAYQEVGVSVPGAVGGDAVIATPAGGLENGLIWVAMCKTNDTVSVVLYNFSGAPVDPAARTWRIEVRKN